MPFKKLNMKNYGYKRCEKNFKQWVTCMKKQENTNRPCLDQYKYFYFCRKKINYKQYNL